jgi:hypothetical protein
MLICSVLVTRVQPNSDEVLANSRTDVYENGDDVNKVSSFIPGGSAYYAEQDVNETHVLLPLDKLETTAGLDIEPACTYAIQVSANPRIGDAGAATPSPSVRYLCSSRDFGFLIY